MKIDKLNMSEHPISLENHLPSQVVSLEMSFEHKETVFWGIKQKPKGKYRLRVVELNAGELVLKENGGGDLVEILCNSQQGADIVIELNDFKTSYTLILNPSKAIDYKKNLRNIEADELSTTVSFRIELTKEGTKKGILSDVISIPVRIEKPSFRLDFEFKFDSPEIGYSPEQVEEVCIGSLEIKHSSLLKCSPELSAIFELEVKSDGDAIPDFIKLDVDNIKETNPVYGSGSISIAGVSPTILDASKKQILQRNRMFAQYRLKNIYSNNPANTISIPVIMDMTRIQNPREDLQKYSVCVSGEYSYMLLGSKVAENITSASSSIGISKNNQLNALKVSTQVNEGDKKELSSGETCQWGKISLSRDLALVNECKITLENLANVQDTANPNACILIENLRQSSFNCDDSRIVLADNGDVRQYFRFKDNAGNQLTASPLRLYPRQTGRGSVFEFNLSIESEAIDEIKRSEADGSFAVPASTAFEFDYAVDLSGNSNIDELEIQSFKGTILWNMEQVANPEWLSIDFGTSAIVASYANGIDGGSSPLLNLAANKKEILRRTYLVDADHRKDDTPEPEPFIPSVISFNSIGNSNPYNLERSDQDFKEYPVWLSPSTGMIDIMLPCLKSLIGYKTIPNILTEAERNSFEYQLEDGTSTKLFDNDGKIVPKGLAYVNNILEEVYKQLFRHYICMDTRNKQAPNPVKTNELHKLVLSVPNTFTPKHHALLKNIAKSFFPMLHPEYLQVVSESDAVACYYLSRRRDFYGNADFLTPQRKSELDANEHVLVFDMGAGTLDLTYFEKSNCEGKMCISMKGKMGMNKAGNYLDYLLGEILCDLLERTNIAEQKKLAFRQRLETDKSRRIMQNTNKRSCEELKLFVRDKVKPMLNEDTRRIPSFNSEYTFESFTMRDIKEHPKYKAYIKECTEDVLDNLISLFAEGVNTDDYMVRPQRTSFPLDVVVFSGRSTTLMDIRNSVSRYIMELENGKEVLCADLNTLTLSKISDIRTDLENVTSLKTVVTFGSLIYADWINRPNLFSFSGKKVFADYGLLIRHVTKGWEWFPLITNRSAEMSSVANPFEVPVLFKGECIYPIDEAKEIIFVQNYSKNTARDWENGNKDLITEIVHFDVPNGVNGNQKISIEIDANNTITCKIQQFGKITLEPHDDFHNESLRKSLWPVAF